MLIPIQHDKMVARRWPVIVITLGLIVVNLVIFVSMMLAPDHASAQQPSENMRKIVLCVTPQYPSLARSMHIQGSVKADVIVAPNGTARSIEVKGGHPLFAQAAQNALRLWKWEPAAHETHESVELRFTP